MNISAYLAIFAGGGLGSLSRFFMSKIVTKGFHHINPMSTLVSNALATFFLGIFLFLIAQKTNASPLLKLFLVTGFCGGFSTFSTLSYETYELLKHGYLWFGIANVVMSVSIGLMVLYFTDKAGLIQAVSTATK